MILIPLVIVCVLYLPNSLFAVLTAVFVSAAAWEWGKIIAFSRKFQNFFYMFFSIVILSISYFYHEKFASGIILAGALWWVCAVFLIIAYQKEIFSIPTGPLFKSIIGILILVPAWMSLVTLHSYIDGPNLVLFLFILIWLADTAAFFVGRRFGRRKLASRTSPAKSWEGVIGAMVITTVLSLLYVNILEKQDIAAGLILLCIITVIFSIVGDLTESMFKRIAGVKDSGMIIPGHGGVLDRIDSLTAAAPVYLTGLWLIQDNL